MALKKQLTLREMSEAVARWCSAEHGGRPVSPEQIFRLNTPGGEVWPLMALYDGAVAAGYGVLEATGGP